MNRDDDHICTICFQSMFEHDERCDCDLCHADPGHYGYFMPPLCCPGCGCESYERAHRNIRLEAYKLTPLMLRVLDATPRSNEIAVPANEIALRLNLDGPRRLGSDWSGHMAPAQRVIHPLIGLRRRGLVTLGRRHDGRSGTAYRQTDACP